MVFDLIRDGADPGKVFCVWVFGVLFGISVSAILERKQHDD